MNSLDDHSQLDFSVIFEGLMLNPEAYVNFGMYWWTLKRMIADWADENGCEVDSYLIRGSRQASETVEAEECEVYQFLDQFSGKQDFMDWISYVNPLPMGDETDGEELILEDSEWEENFL
ncbi:hypothetical protein CEE37_09530 [candidate division LCP-89 bacterium B3_LCP]|uniref:Uncharacterized protein n=1 Tax=candidate division LCP-89 bacterium B3_LCP TaxID=2012998 RepID=A0A532UYZ0_UNCL8|nr:MAG: hypothetical protein CEE37_09530 [candidate division LCP-89 bacterium B3_LCP]